MGVGAMEGPRCDALPLAGKGVSQAEYSVPEHSEHCRILASLSRQGRITSRLEPRGLIDSMATTAGPGAAEHTGRTRMPAQGNGCRPALGAAEQLMPALRIRLE
jgi:hypothetical protein